MEIKLQSAIEYLITYGWALLIIVIALLILEVAGVFNSNSYIHPSCLLPSSFECVNPSFSANGILTFGIKQGTGYPINITGAYCNTLQAIPSNALLFQSNDIAVGGNITISIPCYVNSTAQFSGKPGSIYRGYLMLNYTNLATSFQTTVSGSVVLKAS
jgi:hypothetical protein